MVKSQLMMQYVKNLTKEYVLKHEFIKRLAFFFYHVEAP